MIIQKKAYAKINLYLKILDKLPNGYHNIFTVMQKISLCDNIEININSDYAAGQNISVMCSGENAGNIPADKTNTAYKAAELFLLYLERFSAMRVNIKIGIEIEKTIPSQAGLGGGSSDAASVLLALNEYFDFALPENILLEIAAKIGADVPFFVKNANCAVCEGIGEIVTPITADLSGLSDCHCLIVKPAYNVSTKQAFEDFDKFDKINDGQSPSLLKWQMQSGWIGKKIYNDFAGIIFSQNNDTREIKDLMIKSGAEAAGLSGSGSALFGIFKNPADAKKCKEINALKNNIEFCDIFEFLY